MTKTQTSLFATLQCLVLSAALADEPINVSGVYPHLTMCNAENECGTGAVVPWQGSLWAITYAPHRPTGSSDRLYEITASKELKIFEGSVGGTPANRMIHRETNQLLIGPYVIDAQKHIRVIPSTQMLGRLTANARHLTDPASKIYYATMEEGLYEVDLKTLAVTCLIRDGHAKAGPGVKSELPGYHGKGLYSSQGRVVYANNGENGWDARSDPTVQSGALAEWSGNGDWKLVRRNQFTEVTGPGGIYGNANPDSDPVWSMGWDAKSLILALLDDGERYYYRLPKGSHSYDGAHGWNTEWPRIRDIGEDDLLATMHGTFWRFPKTFSRRQSAGISPRSNYLKVVGDFCRWGEHLVLGCDDSAMSEFLNTRPFKAKHASPGQSNSNLWFVKPGRLDRLGPVIGRGSVWLREDLEAGAVSDPFLFSGYDLRQLALTHDSDHAIAFVLEIDRTGTGEWKPAREFQVEARDGSILPFRDEEAGVWARLRCLQGGRRVTAHFQYRNRDTRTETNASIFAGIATANTPAASYGLMRSLAFDRLGLTSAKDAKGEHLSYYELTPQMELQSVDLSEPTALAAGKDAVPEASAFGSRHDDQHQTATADFIAAVSQPAGGITIDEASVLVIEDGKRYRLPKNASVTPTPVSEPAGKTLEDFLSQSLTLNAKAVAGNVHGAYRAEYAVDGSMAEDRRWIGNKQGDGLQLELDFGAEKTIRDVWIATGWKRDRQYAASDFDVEFKQEGKWKLLPNGAIRDNAEILVNLRLEEAVTTSGLRVSAINNGFFRIYEVAAFEQPIAATINRGNFAAARICREVATERDLLNIAGTFYELPARNAQGIAKIRPVATHNLAIHDFCSHNGLLLFTGIDAETESDRIFRSPDGQAAVWAGVVDDLWQLGKPRGIGGPWKDTAVKAGEPSDPYLMTAYDRKKVSLTSSVGTSIRLEVDIDGTGLWVPWQSFPVGANKTVTHEFPEWLTAYWIRAVSDTNAICTAEFFYE